MRGKRQQNDVDQDDPTRPRADVTWTPVTILGIQPESPWARLSFALETYLVVELPSTRSDPGNSTLASLVAVCGCSSSAGAEAHPTGEERRDGAGSHGSSGA